MRDIFPADLAETFERHFQRTLESDEPIVIEYSLPMPDGERHYETRLVRCDHDTVMTIVRDVTSVRQAEDDLQRAQAELAQAARAGVLGELTAGIAHEVSQPLAAMITNARACLRQLDAGPDRALMLRDALEDIVSDGKRASEVITRVRGMARQTPLKRTPVALNVVVEDVLGLCSRTLRRRRVTVDLDLAPNLPPILGDRVQLQQLLLNLILNGADAMAEVTGRARTLTVRSWRADADRVALAVSDSGTGIEGHDTAAVFAPLASAKGDVAGIGLSISRSIAEAHGGRIRVTRDTAVRTFEVYRPHDPPAASLVHRGREKCPTRPPCSSWTTTSRCGRRSSACSDPSAWSRRPFPPPRISCSRSNRRVPGACCSTSACRAPADWICSACSPAAATICR
jgi:signal transduction histidine kinase